MGTDGKRWELQEEEGKGSSCKVRLKLKLKKCEDRVHKRIK